MTALLVMAFAGGFAFRSWVGDSGESDAPLKRVTGIGGIFFKCRPSKMRDWYKTHLGLNTNEYGAVFEWRQGADSNKKVYAMEPFSEKTKYFEPSTKDFHD